MKRFLLIHYGEIGLKLGNAPYFVDKLIRRVKIKLEERFRETFKIHHPLRRLLIELPENFVEDEYVKVLWEVFGIKNFKFVYEGSADLKELGDEIWNNMPDGLEAENFRVSCKRSMQMDVSSAGAERELGAILLGKGLTLPVKLKGADFEVDVEFFNEHGYFSYKKYLGVGGLSANSQGKLVSLLSAGIDSPVASYKMMKRGARVIFVHFHGYPYTDKDEMLQVQELCKVLARYQFDTKLYLVPYGKIQRAIATNLDVPAKVRTVLYRRGMIRIAEEIARKEHANGLITGDNFGQVASQTPENIFAIHDASTIPIFQPLIGHDKEDIIAEAEKIGTFNVSKLPCKDTCTMFMPKTPELRANVYDIRDYEKNLPFGDWAREALNETEVVSF